MQFNYFKHLSKQKMYILASLLSVMAVLYCVLRIIQCPGTFEIQIAFENKKTML